MKTFYITGTVMNEYAAGRRVTRDMREARHKHRGMVFWLTGLSGAGKSTLTQGVEEILFREGYNVLVLDGDIIRAGLCSDLGFSPEDRMENNRRVAELAKILSASGVLCLCAFISPLAAMRERAKSIIGPECYREVHIACPLQECERRDVKGFYRKAREGLIRNYTGIEQSYEAPHAPDCIVHTDSETVYDSLCSLAAYIRREAGGPGRI